MNIAICFSGGLRTFKLCYKKIITHFEKFGNVDLFISTWEKPCYTQVKKDKDIHAIEGNTKYDELLQKDEKVTIEYLKSITEFKGIDIEPMTVIENIANNSKYLKWTTMCPSRLLCQYYKMARCNNLKLSHEKQSGINYDLNVRIRCDIRIESLPQQLDTDKIYINQYVYTTLPTYKNQMMNEMIYIANTENMNKICELYNNFAKVWWTGGYGEGVSFRYFHLSKLITKCELYNFKVSVHRANGITETIGF